MTGHIPNNPTIAKITFVGHRDTRQWVNVFHAHKISGVVSLGDMLALAPAYKAAWDAAYRNLLTPQIGLDQIQVRKLDPTDPLAVDYTTGLPSFGNNQSPTLEPGNVSLTISWRTGYAGRKFRGRNYIAGIPGTVVAINDTVTTAMVSAVSSLADYLYNAPIVAGGFNPAIFHLGPDTYTEVKSWVIDAILDSMRRRLPGRGR